MKKPLFILLTELLLSLISFSQTEVFSAPTTIKSGLSSAWEVVYGPNDSLWVTENKSYIVSRIKIASNGTKTQLLDLSPVGTRDFPTSGSTPGPQPQGGLMGLAIHPNLYSTDPAVRGAKPWVYLVYVYHRISSSCPSDATATSCKFNTRIVRYNYNGSTLSSPVIIMDALPGSSDHNSGRLVIGPTIEPGADAAHTQYRLYYTIGDMGAGQLTNLTRTENAQNVDVTEGKVLRLNTESDGDAGADAWVPNDNEYYDASNGISGQDYVYSMGHRNPQGLAWGNVGGNNILYGSEQMDRADDEINIITKGHNYGWDKISGKWDGDVNGAKIGQTTVTDEMASALSITNSTEPIFTMFHHNTTWSTYPTAGSSNGPWPTVALSSIDFYKQAVIPGWKNSLLLTPLKENRVYRLKLNETGDQISGDTISYVNGGGDRVRRVRVSPDGTKIYVARDAGSSANGGAIVEYKFLGYANDASNHSTIPATIDITTTTPNTVTAGTTITIDNSNKNYWVPITGPDGNVLAEIYPNGNVLGTVTSTFYVNATIRQDGTGRRYLNRSFTIIPATQPLSAAPKVKVRLYFTSNEYTALDNNSFSGVSDKSDLLIRANADVSPVALTSVVPTPPTTTAFNFGGGYVVEASVAPPLSAFYIGSNSITLPVTLSDFRGALKNTAAFLQWKTTSESNTSQFIVERSANGQHFEAIGTVAARGNSTATVQYDYSDNEVARQGSSIIYYRLKIMDRDGAYKYSDVITITLPFVTGKVSVFPNPASEEVNVSITAPVDGKLQWKLLDNNGRVVLHNNTPLKKGNNNFSININKLPVGLYYLTVSGAGIDQQVKLQKL